MSPQSDGGQGCVTVAVRLPVRLVTLVLVVPFRLLWDALAAGGRALERTVWRPLARALRWCWRRVFAPLLYALFGWPFLALGRYLLRPAGHGALALLRGLRTLLRGAGAGLRWLGHHLLVAPATGLFRNLLVPLGYRARAVGRWLAAGLRWLGRHVLGTPAVALYRWVLAPMGRALATVLRGVGAGLGWLGRGLATALRGGAAVLRWLGHRLLVVPARAVWCALVWLGRILLVIPGVAAYRYLLAPVGRFLAVIVQEVAGALGHAWRVAGYVSRAVYRFLGRVLRLLFVVPVVWVWRTVLAPAGRGVRDLLWRPVREACRSAGRSVRDVLRSVRGTVRQARADARRALFGAPAQRQEQAPAPERQRVG